MSWVCQSVNGCVPAHISPRPWPSAAAVTSARVSARSALASETVVQMPVMISMVDWSSSCLALGCSSAPSGRISSRISTAPAESSRVWRSTSCSSHSTPRLARSEEAKGICTPEV
jgi:hypothetical protein